MFTGIVEELAAVKSLKQEGSLSKLRIPAPKIAPDVQLGQSICVNGVCLTVSEIERNLLCFEVVQETIKRTNLSLLKQGNKVNLERALRVNGRIDGHFVSGHIDGTGIIGKRQEIGGDIAIDIEAPRQILRYIALKSSVALEGVSLTVSALGEGSFRVHLIPYTIKHTTLGLKNEADVVNIECDILAKYADKFLSINRQSPSSNITPPFLQEHGFI